MDCDLLKKIVLILTYIQYVHLNICKVRRNSSTRKQTTQHLYRLQLSTNIT